MNAGDTFFVVDREVDNHLWIVLSDPSHDPQRVVIVNLTTWRADKDQACIVELGEHPFVTHKTCVNYGDAHIVTNRFLDQRLAAGQLRADDAISSRLLNRVRKCAGDSRHMPTAAWDIIERQQDDIPS